MSYARWEVVPSSRHSDGERAVAQCRVSTWHSDGQRLCHLRPAVLLAMAVETTRQDGPLGTNSGGLACTACTAHAV